MTVGREMVANRKSKGHILLSASESKAALYLEVATEQRLPGSAGEKYVYKGAGAECGGIHL